MKSKTDLEKALLEGEDQDLTNIWIQALHEKNEKVNQKIEEALKELDDEYVNISISEEEVAESFFTNFFYNSMSFAGRKYDVITYKHRIYSTKLKLQGEFDFMLNNRDSVVLLEIEYQANKNNVAELLNKARVFRQLYSEYKNCDLYLGLAALHFDSETENECTEQGIAIIKQVGDMVVINDAHLKVF